MPTVYLLHFERPIGNPGSPRGQAQHYIGWAEDLEARLAEHASGQGARITAYLAAAGIEWQCVRTWEGDWHLEKQLKHRKEAPRLCPVCAAKAAARRRLYRRHTQTTAIIPF